MLKMMHLCTSCRYVSEYSDDFQHMTKHLHVCIVCLCLYLGRVGTASSLHQGPVWL